MTANRLRLALTLLFVMAMAALLVWSPGDADRAAAQRRLDAMESDVAAAKDAAARAANSAAEAKAAAQAAQNAVPGSS
jgi:type II secretory pathway component PulM